MVTFKEGDRVRGGINKKLIGTVKAAYQFDKTTDKWVVWVLLDGDAIPTSIFGSLLQVVPPVPKIGEVYLDRGEISRYKVIGIVESPKGTAVVFENDLNPSFSPCVFAVETFMGFYHKVD